MVWTTDDPIHWRIYPLGVVHKGPPNVFYWMKIISIQSSHMWKDMVWTTYDPIHCIYPLGVVHKGSPNVFHWMKIISIQSSYMWKDMVWTTEDSIHWRIYPLGVVHKGPPNVFYWMKIIQIQSSYMWKDMVWTTDDPIHWRICPLGVVHKGSPNVFYWMKIISIQSSHMWKDMVWTTDDPIHWRIYPPGVVHKEPPNVLYWMKIISIQSSYMWKDMVWTTGDPIHWRIYPSTCLNDLRLCEMVFDFDINNCNCRYIDFLTLQYNGPVKTNQLIRLYWYQQHVLILKPTCLFTKKIISIPTTWLQTRCNARSAVTNAKPHYFIMGTFAVNQYQLEQLERLRSEDTPAAPWLPILLTSSFSIPSPYYWPVHIAKIWNFRILL